MKKISSFLLIKTSKNSRKVLSTITKSKFVVWASQIYGPYQIVAYIESDSEVEIINEIEKIRELKGVNELDARRVKFIPKDEELKMFSTKKPVTAVLLINVNYKEEKERIVTYNLREIDGVVFSRAMWGPTDIVTIVEASDHESMRNLICDKIKVLKGVKGNSTLYCYPKE